MNDDSAPPGISVVIPTRNEGRRIATTINAVWAQERTDAPIEVIVVDDGSSDDTVERAREQGAYVTQLQGSAEYGNPARARNTGAALSSGDIIVFLDADCIPQPGWLYALLDAHRNGADIVGGALDLPPGLSFTARCDYYCGCYFIHSRRPASRVPHHPPNNISVRRETFLSTSGFAEHAPLCYTNEERHWQAESRRAGAKFVFETKAIVFHYNRPGIGNLLRRSYRWGYTALEGKSETGSSRVAWLFSQPWFIMLASPTIPFVFTAQIVWLWARVGIREPIMMMPIIFLSRVAYTAGLVVGGFRWLAVRQRGTAITRPSPRWQ